MCDAKQFRFYHVASLLIVFLLFFGFVVINLWCAEHTKVGTYSNYANILLLCPLIPVAACNLARTGILVFVLNLGGKELCGRKRQH